MSSETKTTDAKQYTKQWGWIGFSLPNRNSRLYTYDQYKANEIPDIAEPYEEFKHIRTCKGIKMLERKHSPDHSSALKKLCSSVTSCFISITDETNEPPNMFWCDQQGCAMWCLDTNTNEVYEYHTKVYVAKSIPEFLTRVAIENQIWLHCYLDKTKYPLNQVEQEYMQWYKDHPVI